MDPELPSNQRLSTPGATDANEAAVDRRDFVSKISTAAMAGGLVAGYGTFVAMAGRYAFPVAMPTSWLFVATTDEIPPGGSLSYESPSGVRVTIARRASGGASAAAEDFIALSSVCPHLGCRVHWEAHNRRFFCPCHNGVFDPQGKPVSGPPFAAGQELPRYPLKVERGLLFIAMLTEQLGGTEHGGSQPSAHAAREVADETQEGLA
jgi:Rieske Fe-S protein